MKCTYCLSAINPYEMNWGYILDGGKVSFAHMGCIAYEESMERIETEEYLLEKIGW